MMKDFLVTFAGYLIALISAVFAIVQLRLKHQAEKENLKLQHALERKASYSDNLLSKYQDYLQSINAVVHEAERNLHGGLSERLIRMGADRFSEVIDADAQFALARRMDAELEEWENAQLARLEKLDNLKLFADDELSESLDCFIGLAAEFVRSNINLAAPYQTSDRDDDDARQEHLVKLYADMVAQKRVIEKLMRKDIRPSA